MRTPALSRLRASCLALFAAAGTAAAQGPPGAVRVLGAGGGTFATIQDAVDAAPEGAIVLVIGGTHAENVHVAKPLTLRGTAQAAIRVETGIAVFVDSPAGSVTIENLTIETQSATLPALLYDGLNADDENAATLRNCDIFGGHVGAVINDCDATVDRNRFSGNVQRGLQVNTPVGPIVTAQVSHNVFVGQLVVSGVLQPTSANGMSVFNSAVHAFANTFENLAFGFSFLACSGAAEANVVQNVGIGINVTSSPGFAVVGNTCTHDPAFTDLLKAALRVSGHVRLSATTGALVEGNTLAGATINLAVVNDSKHATIQGNVIRDAVAVAGNSGTGISFNFGSAEGAQVHGNDIVDNETFAVHDFGGTSFTIDATGNWWGSAAGPSPTGPNAIVSPNVLFAPFLLAPSPGAGA